MLFESSVAWVYMPGVKFYIHVDTFFLECKPGPCATNACAASSCFKFLFFIFKHTAPCREYMKNIVSELHALYPSKRTDLNSNRKFSCKENLNNSQ